MNYAKFRLNNAVTNRTTVILKLQYNAGMCCYLCGVLQSFTF